jgi:hypothetical protein
MPEACHGHGERHFIFTTTLSAMQTTSTITLGRSALIRTPDPTAPAAKGSGLKTMHANSSLKEMPRIIVRANSENQAFNKLAEVFDPMGPKSPSASREQRSSSTGRPCWDHAGSASALSRVIEFFSFYFETSNR